MNRFISLVFLFPFISLAAATTFAQMPTAPATPAVRAATVEKQDAKEAPATPAKEAPKEDSAKGEIAAALKLDLTKLKADNFMEVGVKFFKEDRLGEALKQFQEASNTLPENADAYYNIGATYHQMGQQKNSPAESKMAEEFYNRCLDRDDNHVACYRGLAVLLAEQGRVPEAFRLLEGWSARQPKSCDAKIELARFHEEFGDKNSAKKQLIAALGVQKDNPRALKAMGHIYEEMGSPAEALKFYQQSLVADSDQPLVAKQIAALKASLTGEPAPVIVISKGTTNAAGGIVVEDQPARQTKSPIIPPPTRIKRSSQLVANPYSGSSAAVASPYAPATEVPLNATIVPRYQPRETKPSASNYAAPAVPARAYDTAPGVAAGRWATPPTVTTGPYTAAPSAGNYNGSWATPPTVTTGPYTATPSAGAYATPPVAMPAQPVQTTYPPVYGPVPTPLPFVPRSDEIMHVVHRLKKVSAATLANELNAVYSTESSRNTPLGLLVVPDAASNSLLVSGPQSKVEDILQMAKELDRPAAMVQVQVQIDEETESPKANTPEEAAVEKEDADLKEATGNLFFASNPSKRMLFHTVLKSLDNQEATITVSRHEPQVVGMSRSPAGMMTQNVNTISLGTQITLTPRLDSEKSVVLALKINDSRLGPEEEGAVIDDSKEGKPIRTPGTEMFNTQTTVRLEDGKPLLLGGRKINGKIRTVTVTANILRPGETERPKVEPEKK